MKKNKFKRKIVSFFKENIMMIIFVVVGVFMIIKIGAIAFIISFIYFACLTIYALLKNEQANQYLRTMLHITKEENESKTKKRKKVYQRQAEAEGYQVKKFRK